MSQTESISAYQAKQSLIIYTYIFIKIKFYIVFKSAMFNTRIT